MEVAWRVGIGPSTLVDFGVGVAGLILGISVAVGLKVDNGDTAGMPTWVGGVSSGSQPINKMILKIAMNGLLRFC